ncbi:MAG: tetratricopeptide repeat protein [Acidimicrobiia bacterium]
MRRLLALTVILAVTLGGLYAANAALDTEVPVRFRTATVDPTELDRLIGVFAARVEAEPSSWLNRARLGSLYLERASIGNDLDDYDRALVHLETAAAVDRTPDLAIDLARARLALHDFAGALGELDEVTNDSIARRSVSFDALLGLGRLPDAADEVAALERLHPHEPAILIRRAELALYTGMPDRAIDAAEEALGRAEDASLPAADLVFYRSAVARYHLLFGDPDRARGLAEDALGLAPNDPAALLLSARAAAATADLDEAITQAQHAASVSPDPAALGFLADVLAASGDVAGADAQLDTVEAIAALDQPALRRQTAQVLADHGRALELALSMAETELAERDDAYGHHLMATVLAALGRFSEAETHAVRAITVADPVVWYRAGLIAHANGDADLARTRLQAALELQPNFHPIWADHATELLAER